MLFVLKHFYLLLFHEHTLIQSPLLYLPQPRPKSIIMDAARAAVNKITSRKGHTTDVDEYVNPAVVSETVKPHRHEETTEAIDREVHQDHYHTTVQPVAHKEQLPEKHVHNIIPQVEREFKHDNEAETKQRIARELGQFQNTSTTHQTTHSAQAAPTVTGEHVHHHVHETVQVPCPCCPLTYTY